MNTTSASPIPWLVIASMIFVFGWIGLNQRDTARTELAAARDSLYRTGVWPDTMYTAGLGWDGVRHVRLVVKNYDHPVRSCDCAPTNAGD